LDLESTAEKKEIEPQAIEDCRRQDRQEKIEEIEGG
jgi:hypothetical protein